MDGILPCVMLAFMALCVPLSMSVLRTCTSQDIGADEVEGVDKLVVRNGNEAGVRGECALDVWEDEDVDEDDARTPTTYASVSKLLTGCEVVDYLASGMFGSAFKVEDTEKEDKAVLKLMKKAIVPKGIDTEGPVKGSSLSFGEGDDPVIEKVFNAFQREVTTQEEAARHELAPRVRGHTIMKATQNSAKELNTLLAQKMSIDIQNLSEHNQIMSDQKYGVILMDFVEGEPLIRVLARADRPEAALPVFNAVANLIKKLHAEGIYHGDMSFDNTFVDAHKKVMLIDFGKAQLFNPQNAPKHCEAEGVFQANCDVFLACGMEVSKLSDEEKAGCESWSRGELAEGEWAKPLVTKLSDDEISFCESLSRGNQWEKEFPSPASNA